MRYQPLLFRLTYGTDGKPHQHCKSDGRLNDIVTD